MATVNISHTISEEFTGPAEFKGIFLNFDGSVTVSVGVIFNGKYLPGIASILAEFNSLSAAEKPVALKFTKMLVVAAVNNALGTSFTWEQVPTSIFTAE